MSFQHGTNADFYLNGFDATGFLNKVGLDASTDTAEVTTLGKVAKNYIPGLEDATVSFSGFFDGAVGADTTSFSYKVNSLRRVITEATYIPQLDVLGGLCYFTQGELTKHKVETSTDDAGTAELEFQSNTGYERAVTLHILSAETATGNGTSVDNTAGTTNGGSAALHVTTVSGTSSPTITVKVQHSTDNSVWTDLITFSPFTAAGSARAEVTGTVNRYVRAQYTITGTTPSFTFHLAFSRK